MFIHLFLGYIHHRIHVFWIFVTVYEENKEKQQDIQLEGTKMYLVPIESYVILL